MNLTCANCGKDDCKGCLLDVRSPCTDEDPELFYPIGYGRAFARQIAAAKAVCARCPMAHWERCLDEAVTGEYRDGIWGGTTPDERVPMFAPRVTVVDRPEFDEQVARMSRMHLNQGQMAAKLGVSLAVVRRCAQRNRQKVSA